MNGRAKKKLSLNDKDETKFDSRSHSFITERNLGEKRIIYWEKKNRKRREKEEICIFEEKKIFVKKLKFKSVKKKSVLQLTRCCYCRWPGDDHARAVA